MISRSVLQTLTYSDHFGFPLTIDEIYTRFVGADPCVRPLLIQTIGQMLKKNLIQQTGNYYHLPARESLVARRLRRAKISHKLLSRARALTNKLSSVPGVLAIYLTGSLAVGNTRGDADIDFMIITVNSRLWTTRLLLTLFTELFGLRRHPGSTRAAGKLCLNLYLSPLSYLLPPQKRSLYTAYELIQAVPLFDPQNTHSTLLAANPWIHSYLPNFVLPGAQRSDLVGCKPNQKPTRSDLIGIIEKFSYFIQKKYMQKKLTREYITPDSAFFHPNNPGVKVLRKLSQKV